MRLAITRSGVHKGALQRGRHPRARRGGAVSGGPGQPSAETRLHLEIIAARHAGAVMHTHSIWATLLSDRGAARGGIAIEGYEMLKGLAGVADP